MSDPNEITMDHNNVTETVAEDNQTSHPEDLKEHIQTQEVSDGKKKLKIAVAGCSHGEMDKIYAALAELEAEHNFKYDLLICCGDFQAVRNYGDLAHMHVPDKFKSLQTFYKYYSGEKVAPILTVFVGGNHEASGYLSELPYGGWVAPRIYYMGFSNVIKFAGLRIGGLSGIFKSNDFHKGHYERPPYQDDRSDMISAYHVRNFDIWRLKQLKPVESCDRKNSLDIMITHDWPCGITDYGDVDVLLRIKPFFKDDIENGRLGNPATMTLLHDIKPRYWLSAHLHVMFAAFVPHVAKEGERTPEPTRFLSLDKPIPRRHFLHTLEIEVDENAPLKLEYDAHWLAILKSTDHLTSTDPRPAHMPSVHSSERFDFRPTEEELNAIETLGDRTIPENFRATAPPIKQLTSEMRHNSTPSLFYKNPQSTEFCNWLSITDINQKLIEQNPNGVGTANYLTNIDDADMADSNEIRIDDDVFDGEDFVIDTRPTTALLPNEGDNPPNTYLDDFQAPSWKGSKSSDNCEELTLKRRKVDIEDQ